MDERLLGRKILAENVQPKTTLDDNHFGRKTFWTKLYTVVKDNYVNKTSRMLANLLISTL